MRNSRLSFVFLALSFLLIWLFISNYFNNAPTNRTGQPLSDTPSGADSRTGAIHYALQSGRNTWPEMNQGDSAPVSDPELLLATNYYVVLDGSGSMADSGCSGGMSKMRAAFQALADFAQSVPEAANFGLSVFTDGRSRELIPLSRGNRDRIKGLQRQIQPSGSTPLMSSIAEAYARLTRQGRRQLGYGEYHLVVITDGQATAGQEPDTLISKILSESPVMLHTIGFCIGPHHALNRPGQSYYLAADNPQALRRGLDDVLAEAPDFDVIQFSR